MKKNEQARAGVERGDTPVFLAGLFVGLFVMAIQLVLLLDSFDLYVQGKGGRIWQVATAGGLVFFGGLVILWVLHSPPRVPGRRAALRMAPALHKPHPSPRRAA